MGRRDSSSAGSATSRTEGLTRCELLATRRVAAVPASRLLAAVVAPDQVTHVGVLAALAVATLAARLAVLEALAVVLQAAALLAVAASCRRQAGAMVG